LIRKIITTSDGSRTIHIEDWDEQYHSKHGAIQEAYHVFIGQGLSLFNKQSLTILEIGFGTGLNALITLIEAQKKDLNIKYTGVEGYPISMEELSQLNFIDQLQAHSYQDEFLQMHTTPWNKTVVLSKQFTLIKQQKDFMEVTDKNCYHLVYFDAFGARVQPELWTERLFGKMYQALKPNGILVTYAAKGSVRRAMQAVGFTVERLPGPPGKREMLKALKPA